MGISIDVCVATFRRPHLLERLLTSLADQTVRGRVQYRIIVVDNDALRSAEPVVTSFREASGLDVLYAVAVPQGISYARNQALHHATAPMVAFIDDDEAASPAWLASLVEALEVHEADAVFGPVVPEFPTSAPSWARSHPAFMRPRYETGTRMATGASGNVLIRQDAICALEHWFDPAYARTGGEDTEFFARGHARGWKLIWCDEADVREFVPPERLGFAWVCRRAYRGGRTFFSIFVQQRTWRWQALWLAPRALASAAYLLMLPFWWLRDREVFAVRLTRLCGWLGQLSQLFGNRFAYEEYRAARY